MWEKAGHASAKIDFQNLHKSRTEAALGILGSYSAEDQQAIAKYASINPTLLDVINTAKASMHQLRVNAPLRKPAPKVAERVAKNFKPTTMQDPALLLPEGLTHRQLSIIQNGAESQVVLNQLKQSGKNDDMARTIRQSKNTRSALTSSSGLGFDQKAQNTTRQENTLTFIGLQQRADKKHGDVVHAIHRHHKRIEQTAEKLEKVEQGFDKTETAVQVAALAKLPSHHGHDNNPLDVIGTVQHQLHHNAHIAHSATLPGGLPASSTLGMVISFVAGHGGVKPLAQAIDTKYFGKRTPLTHFLENQLNIPKHLDAIVRHGVGVNQPIRSDARTHAILHRKR